MLPHVPAGGFKVGKLSQASQFQSSFHFIRSGSHTKELFSALCPKQVTLRRVNPRHGHGYDKAISRPCLLRTPCGALRGEVNQGTALGQVPCVTVSPMVSRPLVQG